MVMRCLDVMEYFFISIASNKYFKYFQINNNNRKDINSIMTLVKKHTPLDTQPSISIDSATQFFRTLRPFIYNDSLPKNRPHYHLPTGPNYYSNDPPSGPASSNNSYGYASNNSNNGSGGQIRFITWNNAATRIACGKVDRSIRVWNPDRHDVKFSTEIRNAHDKSIEGLSWDPKHPDFLASCSTDRYIKLWDVKLKKELIKIKTGFSNLSVKYSPDGKYLAVLRKDNVVVFLDVENNYKLIFSFKANETLYDMTWSNTCDYVILANGIGEVSIYRFPRDEIELKLNEDQSQDVEMIDAHDSTISTNTSLRSINNRTTSHEIVIDLEKADPDLHLEEIYTIAGQQSAITVIKFDPKGKYLVSGSSEGLVSVIDLEEFVCIRTFAKIDKPILSVDFSHDGAFLAISYDNSNQIDIVHVESGKYVFKITREKMTSLPIVAWNPLKYSLAFSGDPEGLSILLISGRRGDDKRR